MLTDFYFSSADNIQFDIYDYSKFHSNAGVRSDLFKRKASETLLTDFFGGVSQAEVVESPPSIPSDDENVEVDVEETPIYATPQPEVLSIPQTVSIPVDVRALMEKFPRTLRAWGAIGLVGVLLVWVCIAK